MLSSPFTGLFTAAGPAPPETGDPDVRLWSAALMPRALRRVAIDVGGAGWTEADARAAAEGEGLERFEALPLRTDGLIDAAVDRWPLDEPPVVDWVLFHPDQYARPGFPFRPLERSTACRWAAFRRAGSGEPAWVPEDVAFLFPSAHRLCPGLSTGLACAATADRALLRGAQEVVERDAVLGAWWGLYPLEAWDLEPPLRLRRPHLRYRFFRAATPYSAHAAIVTVEGDGLFAAGSAVRETRAASWEKASLEAVHALAFARHVRRTRSAEDLDALRDFASHAAYYGRHPGRLAETPFRRAAAPDGADEDRTEGLGALAERLGTSHPILFRLMTPPGLTEAGVVVRVVVPGLQPLHGDARLAHLGGPLWAPRDAAAFDAWPPHPFA